MAHNINFNAIRGTYSFASHKEKPWHGLGQILDKPMTAEQAIREANLDYEVDKTTISFTTQDSILQDINGYYATYRKDNGAFLGLVKGRYHIVQNKDSFAFFDSIIHRGEAIYETAGVLGAGERIFLLAKLPDDIKVGGEVVDKYILLMNSHDGSSSVVAGMTNIRVVCNNTLQAALGKLENKVSITHTSTAQDKLKEAYKVMKLQSEYSAQIQSIFNRMTDVKMTEGQYMEYFEKVFTPEYNTDPKEEISTRLKNTLTAVYAFSQEHPTQKTAEATNTLWGAYNAVSGYYNYVKEYKNPEDKFRSTMGGLTAKKVLKAFNESVNILN
jgi:phage/plasmid-like protein (TIGR03299 family)